MIFHILYKHEGAFVTYIFPVILFLFVFDPLFEEGFILMLEIFLFFGGYYLIRIFLVMRAYKQGKVTEEVAEMIDKL